MVSSCPRRWWATPSGPIFQHVIAPLSEQANLANAAGDLDVLRKSLASETKAGMAEEVAGHYCSNLVSLVGRSSVEGVTGAVLLDVAKLEQCGGGFSWRSSSLLEPLGGAEEDWHTANTQPRDVIRFEICMALAMQAELHFVRGVERLIQHSSASASSYYVPCKPLFEAAAKEIAATSAYFIEPSIAAAVPETNEFFRQGMAHACAAMIAFEAFRKIDDKNLFVAGITGHAPELASEMPPVSRENRFANIIEALISVGYAQAQLTEACECMSCLPQPSTALLAMLEFFRMATSALYMRTAALGFGLYAIEADLDSEERAIFLLLAIRALFVFYRFATETIVLEKAGGDAWREVLGLDALETLVADLVDCTWKDSTAAALTGVLGVYKPIDNRLALQTSDNVMTLMFVPIFLRLQIEIAEFIQKASRKKKNARVPLSSK